MLWYVKINRQWSLKIYWFQILVGLLFSLSVIAIALGLGNTGLGQTTPFAASHVQNSLILSYKYNCLPMSSTLSVITSGSCPAVDCTFSLSTFTETGLAEFVSFTSTHIGSSVWNWKLWYLVKFLKDLKKFWWYVLGHKTPLAFSGPEQSVECCVHFYLTYELILVPAEIQKKFFSFNQIHYMMLLKGWQSVVK